MKKIFALLLALTMAISLAACGSNEDTSSEDAATATEGESSSADPRADWGPEPTETTEVVVWTFYGETMKNQFQDVADAFNASQTKYHVTIESQGSQAEMNAKIQSTAQEDLPAIFHGAVENVAMYAAADYCVPIQEFIDMDEESWGELENTWAAIRTAYQDDAGNQIEKFAKSLEARYFQIFRGEDAVEFPEDGYHGDDIRELARLYADAHGDDLLHVDEKTRHDTLAQFGLAHNIPKMKADLARYGIQYDEWFFESSLHESGYVADSVAELTKRGYTYEKDGALWLKTSEILTQQLKAAGKSDEAIEKLGLKDDVLRRANGLYTYFAADIAYHRNKFAVRGFDKVINIWGADHHGHVARLKGAMDALGLDGTHRLDIVLMQLVKLVQDGEVVRMSKRTGKAVSLTDLLDMVPVDACRYFFNAKPETQMEFDLGLAVREDSENPVYYVQYAHARICTLLKNLAADGHVVPAPDAVDFALLTDPTELALIKQIASYCDIVRLAARDYDPSFINRYLTDLAAAFHKFYNACRIKGEAESLLNARLLLADTARSVLKNGMELIGCSAPEKM